MASTCTCPHCGSDVAQAAQEGVCPNCGHALLPGRAEGIPVGTTLGEFRIERRLGGGGMGEVFLATQLTLDRKVALKVLPESITRDPERLADFRQEMRNLAKLDHPNVATAFTAGEHQGTHFLAMAYVDGEDLAQRLEREGPLPEGEALDGALKVAEALKHAWDRHQLLHRDVKPGNIMIDQEGTVKLMDMGLSKTLYEDLGVSRGGTIVGTPNYMSPELARGESAVGVAADIYALGVTLHHLLTGQLPFAADTPEQVLDAVLAQALPSVPELRPDVSKLAADLVARLTAKDPACRYPGWDEVIRDLQRALRGGDRPAPVEKAPGERMRRVRRSTGEIAASHARERARQTRTRRRRRVTAVLATLAAAAAVGGGGAYLHRARQATDQAEGRARVAEEEKVSAEERAAALEAEAEAKSVEAAVARALVHADVDTALAGILALRDEVKDPDLVQTLTETTWQLEARIEDEVQAALSEMDDRSQALWDTGDYQAAAEVFSAYQGPHAERTRAAREARAAGTLEAGRQAEATRRANAEVWYADAQANILGYLLNGRSDEAVAEAEALLRKDLTPEVEARGTALMDMVYAVERMPSLVLGAYAKYLGRETTVYFRDGKQRVEILEVGHDRVRAVYHGPQGDVPREFGIEDLGLREKVVRLGRTRRADLDVIRGLLAYRGGRDESARRYLQLADHELAGLLLVAMEQRESDTAPEKAGERTSS
jgi:hypothetical protein